VGNNIAECQRTSKNVEADGKRLKSLDVARGMSAECVGRSRDVDCRRRQGRGRTKGCRLLNTSISDRDSEILF
jgi:hypothetical protein